MMMESVSTIAPENIRSVLNLVEVAYLADVRLRKAFITMYCGSYRVVVLRNEFKGADVRSIARYIAREELGQTDQSIEA
jgi:hypothetical protein